VERRIPLEGCLNFRDLGGYPAADGRRVRWRLLFRSDALHHLKAEDVVHLRDVIGLSHVLDLRSSSELVADGRGPLEREPLGFHHLPLFDGDVQGRPADLPSDLAGLYFAMAEFAAGPIARVLEILARASGPAVYHCAAGKDRTGVVSAVLLGLLGVPDELIVADYAATRDALDGIVERLMSSHGYQDVLATLPPDTLHAEPATMVSLLAKIRDRHGSMRAYVDAIGVCEADVARLEERLLEASPS
jgi:protein-tyrosine phosphatase